MKKPALPSIDNETAVVEWFLKYDDKVKLTIDDPVLFNRIKNEILTDLQKHNDGPSLKEFISVVSKFYWDNILPKMAEDQKNNRAISNEIILIEILLSAKMRILGYLLLKKYGIQPE